MENLEIVGFWAALLILLQIVLTFRVIAIRRRDRISMGHNKDKVLESRVRAHGNFTETVPIFLIGLSLVAMLGGNHIAIHALGALVFVGRILHMMGMAGPHNAGKGRPLGMLMTLIGIIAVALYLLFLSFS